MVALISVIFIVRIASGVQHRSSSVCNEHARGVRTVIDSICSSFVLIQTLRGFLDTGGQRPFRKSLKVQQDTRRAKRLRLAPESDNFRATSSNRSESITLKSLPLLTRCSYPIHAALVMQRQLSQRVRPDLRRWSQGTCETRADTFPDIGSDFQTSDSRARDIELRCCFPLACDQIRRRRVGAVVIDRVPVIALFLIPPRGRSIMMASQKRWCSPSGVM